MTTYFPFSYRMLIVDDDDQVGMALQTYFESMGYVVVLVAIGEQALENMLSTPPFDIVLMDVMLPKKNGFEILHEARSLGITTPVLMLTGRSEQENILKGFGLGAEDYIVKPFHVEELSARVNAILTRTQPPNKAPMTIHMVGEVVINFSTHEAYREDQPVTFTAKEFAILRLLIAYKGQIVTRDQMLRTVWGNSDDSQSRKIDRHIAALRKKISSGADGVAIIKTLHNVGYRYDG